MSSYALPGNGMRGAYIGDARFIAAYSGTCDICWRDIEPGDTAGYIDNEVCCEACCDERFGED